MKIIMMRPTYKPELSGGTHLAADLVEDMIKKGHTVKLITPISRKYLDRVNVDADECEIVRVVSKYEKKDVLSRVLRYVDVSRMMYKEALKIQDADVIMTHSMPPLLGPLGVKLGRKKKLPVVYWEQDIVSDSLISTGVFGKGNLKQKIAYGYSRRLERKTEKGSTHIITISERFKRNHIERGIPEEKIDIVYNWIDTDQIYPVERRDNPLFDELDIPRDKFIVTYCGNLGVPQNVEIMIEAAEMLQENKEILFVIIGSGSREKRIKEIVEQKNLPNLKLYPLQPLERSHFVYSIGDVGLVIGKAGTSKNGFPSKTWSIMAAGQAMIACFDEDSELCGFVRSGNCGITVAPDSPALLAGAVEQLFSDRGKCEEMKKNAREYVTKNFGREAATGRIVEIVESAARQ